MRRTAAILISSTILLAGCGSEPAPPAPQPTETATPTVAATPAATAEPTVTDAWVQLPAAPGRPAAAYFKLQAGNADSDILLAVTSTASPRVEFHLTKEEGTVSKMEKFDVHALGPNEVVDFAPGGKHLMLFDLKPGIKAGDKIPLTFEFQSGKKLTVEAEAKAAGS